MILQFHTLKKEVIDI